MEDKSLKNEIKKIMVKNPQNKAVNIFWDDDILKAKMYVFGVSEDKKRVSVFVEFESKEEIEKYYKYQETGTMTFIDYNHGISMEAYHVAGRNVDVENNIMILQLAKSDLFIPQENCGKIIGDFNQKNILTT